MSKLHMTAAGTWCLCALVPSSHANTLIPEATLHSGGQCHRGHSSKPVGKQACLLRKAVVLASRLRHCRLYENDDRRVCFPGGAHYVRASYDARPQGGHERGAQARCGALSL